MDARLPNGEFWENCVFLTFVSGERAPYFEDMLGTRSCQL